jgi:septal ring-binding cell division protein DamX
LVVASFAFCGATFISNGAEALTELQTDLESREESMLFGALKDNFVGFSETDEEAFVEMADSMETSEEEGSPILPKNATTTASTVTASKPAFTIPTRPTTYTKPTVAKPTATKPTIIKPAFKPAETKPTATKPAFKPADTKPAATKPTVAKPAASKPAVHKDEYKHVPDHHYPIH